MPDAMTMPPKGLIAWSVWRSLGGQRPKGLPSPIPPLWWEWRTWCLWTMRGRPKPRPATIRERVPEAWWAWKAMFVRSLDSDPEPSPIPVTLDALARNVVFCAQEPLTALASPPHYKVGLSADVARSAQWNTAEVIAELRAKGRVLMPWSDCRPLGQGTPARFAKEMAAELGVADWIGQGETREELEDALATGARLVIGNPNAWSPQQRQDVIALVNSGRVAVLNEVYTNVAHPWPDSYGTQGVPVASHVLGLYDGSHEYATGRYVPLADYKRRTSPSQWPHIGVYYSAGARRHDLEELP